MMHELKRVLMLGQWVELMRQLLIWVKKGMLQEKFEKKRLEERHFEENPRLGWQKPKDQLRRF